MSINEMMDMQRIAPKNFILLLAIGFVVSAIVVFALIYTAPRVPKVGLLEISHDNVLTLHAKTGYPEFAKNNISAETFFFCISMQDDASTCAWQETRTFHLTEEGTYYAFVKSVPTEKISESKPFNYFPMDYSNLDI